jgi:hypothetical protein
VSKPPKTYRTFDGTILVHDDRALIGCVRDGGCENERCLEAIAAGRVYHAIPTGFAVTLPDYHFASIDDAVSALDAAPRRSTTP